MGESCRVPTSKVYFGRDVFCYPTSLDHQSAQFGKTSMLVEQIVRALRSASCVPRRILTPPSSDKSGVKMDGCFILSSVGDSHGLLDVAITMAGIALEGATNQPPFPPMNQSCPWVHYLDLEPSVVDPVIRGIMTYHHFSDENTVHHEADVLLMSVVDKVSRVRRCNDLNTVSLSKDDATKIARTWGVVDSWELNKKKAWDYLSLDSVMLLCREHNFYVDNDVLCFKRTRIAPPTSLVSRLTDEEFASVKKCLMDPKKWLTDLSVDVVLGCMLQLLPDVSSNVLVHPSWTPEQTMAKSVTRMPGNVRWWNLTSVWKASKGMRRQPSGIHLYPTIESKHWFLMVVDFERRGVASVDSFNRRHDKEAGLMGLMVKVALAGRKDGGKEDVALEDWRYSCIKLAENCCQDDTDSCGLFVCAFVFHFMLEGQKILDGELSITKPLCPVLDPKRWREFMLRLVEKRRVNVR